MEFLEGKTTRIHHGYHYVGTKLLHRAIWEHFHGPIPKNHVIHHKNGDKLNNSLENLECLTQSEHSRLHRLQDSKLLADRMSKNSEKLHEWHRSEIGRKTMAARSFKQFEERPVRTFTCENCKKEFQSKHTTHVKFCGDNCVMSARNKTGKDNEERKCLICSNPFTINKYQLTKTCSKPCRAKYIGNLKRKSK